MPTRADIRAQLTGPGGPFELTQAKVLGEEVPVFAKRLGSLNRYPPQPFPQVAEAFRRAHPRQS